MASPRVASLYDPRAILNIMGKRYISDIVSVQLRTYLGLYNYKKMLERISIFL